MKARPIPRVWRRERLAQVTALLRQGFTRDQIAAKLKLSKKLTHVYAAACVKMINGRPPILTPQQREEIRHIDAQRRAMPSRRELARIYGVSLPTIASICQGKKFKHDGCHEYSARIVAKAIERAAKGGVA